jgi:glutamyl-tRNA synthetase
MVLRIEDTDLARSKKEFVDDILDGLRWLGLDWDEGPEIGGPFAPYFQSERFGIYQEEAEALLDAHKAYRCYCTEEELEERRAFAVSHGLPPRYSGKCRRLSPAEEKILLAQGRKPSVRFVVPEQEVVFEDLLRGEVSFDTTLLGDFVIQKSDGSPSYNFAAAVDDAFMEISHIVRGEDHLPNTPRQILLYQAMGKNGPLFAHLPMILGADRTKLSKRHGSTSITQYREMGYLPEALVNYLALLGWAPPGGKEILSLGEMVEKFQLERLSHGGAIFDLSKLTWLNRQYILRLSKERFVAVCEPFLPAGSREKPGVAEAIALVQESVSTLAEVPREIRFLLEENLCYPPSEVALFEEDPVATEVLREFVLLLERGCADARALVKEKGYPMKQVFPPIRFALTASLHGPELTRIIELLGIERAQERCRRLLEILERPARANP